VHESHKRQCKVGAWVYASHRNECNTGAVEGPLGNVYRDSAEQGAHINTQTNANANANAHANAMGWPMVL